MKTSSIIAVALVAPAAGFSTFTGSRVSSNVQNSAAMTMEYIPSGMSKDQWRKMKDSEKKKNKGKDLGKSGITSFKSRSFAEWQKAGGKNLFPVDPKSVKSVKDLPYMQRPGGVADDSDIKKKGGFSLFGKKKAPEPEPEPEKKKNFWNF